MKFLARGRGYALFLTQDEAVLALTKGPGDSAVVRMSLVGAQPSPRVTGLEKLPGIVNYFIGDDPTRWRTSIPTYARVRYESVYPGVDLVYHGSQGALEYDFVVAPGADPGKIRLAFEGPDSVAVDSQGDLVIRTKGGQLRLRKPIVYQELDGARRPVAGSYALETENRVGFRVAEYDTAKPLVIDPVLVYSTYLGGTGTDQARGIALGPGGTAYVVGSTDAPSFPSAASTNLGPRGGSDVFVAKIDPAQPGLSSLVYLTFIGGRGTDTGRAIDVDGAGNAYLTGQTFSSDFPTTPSAYSTKSGGKADAFVAKLNSAGTALVYSTFLGGGGPDEGHAIAIACASASDPTNCTAYVTGATLSSNFPITPFAVFAKSQGKQDAFVTKLSVDGSSLLYSTYLGGTGTDAGNAIALECGAPSSGNPPDCNAWVTGETSSVNFFTTVGAFDRVFNGNVDAFVTKFNAGGSALLYSSYLGGTGVDRAFGIALDGLGHAYVAGSTDSPSFIGDYQTKNPTTLGPGGGGDAFVAKIDLSAPSQLAYLTYVGGTASDLAYALDVDGFGNVYLTGETSSANFPTVNSLPLALGVSTHAFVARLDPSGSAFTYSTYLGGNGFDRGFGIIANAGRVFVVGETSSTDFPTSGTVPPFDASFGGGSTDAFLTVLGGSPPVFGPVSNLMFYSPTGSPLTVNYPIPTALDASGSPAFVSCNPPPGSVFPVGDTPVTCTATTNDGGSGTITFIITVTTTAPPTLGLNVSNVTVRQGDPIVLTAVISVPQSTTSITTITPDCVNTTWTITRPNGSGIAPRFRERMYGIPNDLTTITAGVPFIINCDISQVIDPSLLPPLPTGQSYTFFATYSNYIQDADPTPPVFNVWTGSVNSPSATLTVVGSVTRVQIDVKPTSFPSSFNCKNVDNTIDVAVLSGEVFDPNNPTADPRPVFNPTSIDVNSVRFGKTGTEAPQVGYSTSDLNGDGVLDRVFKFIFGQTGFSCADTLGQNSADVVGILTGNTSGGPISGSDTIHLVGGP